MCVGTVTAPLFLLSRKGVRIMKTTELEHENKEINESGEPLSSAALCGCDSVQLREPKSFVDKILVNSFGMSCFVASVLLVLIITIATFVRYIVKGDLYGYDEWAKLIAIWLYFMGAAYGAFNESHVTADLVVGFIPDGIFRRSLILLKDTISLGICLLFLWYGYDFFMFSLLGPVGTGVAIPMTSVWRIPMWMYNLAIFLGLACMAFYLIKYFLRDIFLLLRAVKGDRAS